MASGISWALWIFAFFCFMFLPDYWFVALMCAAVGIVLKVTVKMSLVGTMWGSTVTDPIGGVPFYILEFGDELVYFTPYTITLFLLALTFTVLVIISRPERQIDIAFGGDAYTTKEISFSEMQFRRFMAIACGLASMGAMVTGDIFNFTLFTAMVGITNVGIVAAVKSPHVQDAAFQYGLVALCATVPLFGGQRCMRHRPVPVDD